jgi:hypothetical protein
MLRMPYSTAMAGDRAEFTFHNQHDDIVELIVEPWAVTEEIPANGIAKFEVNAAPPPEIEFSVTDRRQAYVYVMSEWVQISVNGVVKHNFTTNSRPPFGAFRVLRKVLWSG